MSEKTTKFSEDDEFYIVDVRAEFSGNPYVTLWRPKNAGYAYPTEWSGRYTRSQIDAEAGYYYKPRFGHKRTLDRYPVPCKVVDELAVEPARGLIDGNAGLVLPNTPEIRKALRKARYIPEGSDKRKAA